MYNVIKVYDIHEITAKEIFTYERSKFIPYPAVRQQ